MWYSSSSACAEEHGRVVGRMQRLPNRLTQQVVLGLTAQHDEPVIIDLQPHGCRAISWS